MGKLFGTDGIRGVAGKALDVSLACRVGRAAAIVLGKEKGRSPLFLIGKDTRLSSDMLEAALTAGLCSEGARVVSLGICPTPAVAYLTVEEGADAGIVISASHNPFEDNGIKIFNCEGYKLSDTLEDEIEAILASGEEPVSKTGDEIGTASHKPELIEKYIEHLASTTQRLASLRVLVDCANGAATITARELFGRFPLEADYINESPDGVNINKGCGSTDLKCLSTGVKDGGYDIGLAFDGDADRFLAVDELGREIDGDIIMALCGMAMKKQGKLINDAIVATVMSNCGFEEYCNNEGIKLLRASVGDRNVLEMMLREGCVLGGENSGHLIFLQHSTTGDGQLAALKLLELLSQNGKKASELVDLVHKYPQKLIGVSCAAELKSIIMEATELLDAIRAHEQAWEGQGRILVRPSGTEPKIRVMVEHKDEEITNKVARDLSDMIKNLQNRGSI